MTTEGREEKEEHRNLVMMTTVIMMMNVDFHLGLLSALLAGREGIVSVCTTVVCTHRTGSTLFNPALSFRRMTSRDLRLSSRHNIADGCVFFLFFGRRPSLARRKGNFLKRSTALAFLLLPLVFRLDKCTCMCAKIITDPYCLFTCLSSGSLTGRVRPFTRTRKVNLL